MVCSSPPLQLRSTALVEGNAIAVCVDMLALEPKAEVETLLPSRIDYRLGLHKFSGYASLPFEQSLFDALWADLTVFLLIVLHRHALLARGIRPLDAMPHTGQHSTRPTPPPSPPEASETEEEGATKAVAAPFLASVAGLPAARDAEMDAEVGAEWGADGRSEQGAEVGVERGAEVGAEQGAEVGAEQGAEVGAERTVEVGAECGAQSGADLDSTAAPLASEVAESSGEGATVRAAVEEVTREGGAGGRAVESAEAEEVLARFPFAAAPQPTFMCCCALHMPLTGQLLALWVLSLAAAAVTVAGGASLLAAAIVAAASAFALALVMSLLSQLCQGTSLRRSSRRVASNGRAEVRSACEALRGFGRRLLPSAWHAKSSDTDLSMPTFAVSLLLWLFSLLSFSTLTEGTVSQHEGERFGTSRFDSSTVLACAAYASNWVSTCCSITQRSYDRAAFSCPLPATVCLRPYLCSLFITIGVMVADRIIYRLWAPPTAIDAALPGAAPHVMPLSRGAEGTRVNEGTSPSPRITTAALGGTTTAPVEPSSAAPHLKLLMHIVVTCVVHGSIFFALPLWRCDRSDCEHAAAECGGCEQSSGVRLYYLLACCYLYLSATQAVCALVALRSSACCSDSSTA